LKPAAVLFLPVYVPDFSPIEQAFSMTTTLVLRAKPCEQDALWKAIGTVLTGVNPTDA
jgi:transposase